MSQRGNILLYGLLVLAILGVLSGIGYAIYDAGRKAERAEWQARETRIAGETALKLEAANKRVRETEQAIAAAIEDASIWYQGKLKEKDNALNIALNGLRAGTGRLFVTARCPAPGGDPATGPAAGAGGRDGPTRAELSAADSEFLLRRGAEADGIVHQLTACQAVIRADRRPR